MKLAFALKLSQSYPRLLEFLLLLLFGLLLLSFFLFVFFLAQFGVGYLVI